MTEAVIRKKEGFQGQKAIVIPRKILASQCEKNTIVGTLYITDIGYYPKAKFHYRERSHGVDQHILIYCIEGRGKVEILRKEYAIKSGEFFIVPSHVAHKYSADAADPWTIYWVHFKGNISNAIVSLLQQQIGNNKGFIQYNEGRINLFNKIYNQLEKGYGIDNLAYANMSFWYLLSTFMFQEKYNSSDKISNDDLTGRAINFMTKKIDKMVSVEEIAQSVNLSASHFTSLFKKKTGFSPIEYFNHLKIQEACQYFLFTDLRIKEVSFKLGIDDPYYFSRLFTKVMGMSPNLYREKNHSLNLF
jgi:AraC-like DNA-binding protein/mannose-6-phosphate isomerase-like protein (cupin superfamily)